MSVHLRAHTICLVLICSALVSGAGCRKVYYQTMEKFGYEKRDLLVDRVDEAREAQEEAKVQFESALEQFMALTNFDGGDLEAQYRKLSAEYDESVEDAQRVKARIEGVETVGNDLFYEWEQELDQYSNQDLRRQSQQQLHDTKQRYRQLIAAMKRAESKTAPVLGAFNDRVLFLKHNLNARAIGALRTDRAEIEAETAVLIREMNASIAEADRFIEAMRDTRA